LIIGAVISAPFAWYLSGYPVVRLPSILIPLTLGGAAYAVHKQKGGIAWLLLSPLVLVSAWLAYIVLSQ
jgi:hypothetical protein